MKKIILGIIIGIVIGLITTTKRKEISTNCEEENLLFSKKDISLLKSLENLYGVKITSVMKTKMFVVIELPSSENKTQTINLPINNETDLFAKLPLYKSFSAKEINI